MSAAKATGAQPNGSAPNGDAKNRSHHDGSSTRAFTTEQKEAVIRIRKCSPTAFYDVLGLESERATVTDGGIKKAYRKLSLLTHPDKNGYPGSDEAFKMVSRAFQILSDSDKKTKFDRFGGDPDNRFSSSGAGAAGGTPFASPFSGFARSQGARAGPGASMFEEEMTPEEMFRQFFGGGGFGGGPFGGGLFDSSGGGGFTTFVGPGVRVHQFGGGRPRRRPPGSNGNMENQPQTAGQVLQNLLPLLIVVILPILSSLLSGISSLGSGTSSSSANLPVFSLDKPEGPLTQQRTSPTYGVNYYINPSDIGSYITRTTGSKSNNNPNSAAALNVVLQANANPRQYFTSSNSPSLSKAERKALNSLYRSLDDKAERYLHYRLDTQCRVEQTERQRLVDESWGWFSNDDAKLNRAKAMDMKGCNRLTRVFGRQ